jgi:hypothetical protein
MLHQAAAFLNCIVNAEILPVAPTSGYLPEYHFGEHFSSRLWVRFFTAEEEWIGCFAKGHDQIKSDVVVSTNNERAFINAGGKGYLIDLTQHRLLLELPEHPYVESVVSTLNPNYFVIGQCFSICMIDEHDNLKTIKPDFMVDGIFVKSQVDQKVVGKVQTAENQYDKPMNFELDLESLVMRLMRPKKKWWEL